MKIALATVLEIAFPRELYVVAKTSAIVTVWLLELEADGAISDAKVFIAVVKAELVELVAISSVGLLVLRACMTTSSTLLFVVGCGRMAATFPEAVAVSSPELEECVRFTCLYSALRAICTPGLVANKVKLRLRVMHKTLVLRITSESRIGCFAKQTPNSSSL